MKSQPVQTVAPATEPVDLAEMKAWLRVTHALEDALIQSLMGSAVAHLDGWTGVLGRAIMTQTWKEEFSAHGFLRLALPDVVSVVVTAKDADGNALTVTTADLGSDAAGWFVETEGDGATDVVIVTYVCALPAAQLDAARLVIKLLVAHWFRNREAVVVGTNASDLPMAVTALIRALAWVQF